jgi:hypothetical protein
MTEQPEPAGTMRQYAPFPVELALLVADLDYRPNLGWQVELRDVERDHTGVHDGAAGGLTLIVTRQGPDTYHPEQTIRVAHYFPVPAATYDRRSWQRWLFDRLGDVDTHERMEDFVIAGTRPYAPSHGPGNDPYLIRETGTDLDRRTAFTGQVNPPDGRQEFDGGTRGGFYPRP